MVARTIQFYSTSSCDLRSLRTTSSSSINRPCNQIHQLVSLPSLRSSRVVTNCTVCFRHCIDIHKGKVKKIVGSTLRDSKEDNSAPVTNFESDKSAAEYAKLYNDDGLTGRHVIMLGAEPLSKSAAIEALHACPEASELLLGLNLGSPFATIDLLKSAKAISACGT